MPSHPWGPLAVPAQPGGHHIPRPRLTHTAPAPHLASRWGWYSPGGGGRSHLVGKSEDPRGPVTPREGSASLRNTCHVLLAGLRPGPRSPGQRLGAGGWLSGHGGQPSFWGSAPGAPLPPALTPSPTVTAADATLPLGHGRHPPGSPLVKGWVLIRIAIDLKVKGRKGKGYGGERPACAERPHVPGAGRGEKGQALRFPASEQGPAAAPTSIVVLPRTFLSHEATPLTEMAGPTPPLPPSLTPQPGCPSPRLHLL